MIIKGKIEAKKMTQEGTGQKGPWQRWVYTIGGKDYSTFEKKIYMFFNVGDDVQMQTITDKSGKYENMVSMEKVAVEAPKAEIQAVAVVPKEKQEFHQSIEACRYEAMDIAIKMHPLLSVEEQKSNIYNRAEVILNWILRGK